MFYIYVLGFDN